MLVLQWSHRSVASWAIGTKKAEVRVISLHPSQDTTARALAAEIALTIHKTSYHLI